MADPALTSSLKLDGVYFFGAVRIGLPNRPLLLLDGAGTIVINGETYAGEDSEFGCINSIDQISDSIGEEAPQLLLTLYPKDNVAASILVNRSMQGAPVQILFGAVNEMTGLIIGQPQIKFIGEIDVPTLINENGSRAVEFTIVSVFERLFELDEGVRANDSWHQSIWPGEKGFEYMTATDKNLYWASKKPEGQTSASTGGSIDYGYGSINNR